MNEFDIPEVFRNAEFITLGPSSKQIRKQKIAIVMTVLCSITSGLLLGYQIGSTKNK